MYSYDSSDLTTDLNQVRRLIGDTDSTAPEFQDEEIAFFVSTESNVFGAASIACGALAAKYALQVDKSVDDLRISASQKFAHYKDLEVSYRAKAKYKGSPQVYAGGISVADKATQAGNSDRPAPAFSRDMFDYAGGTT